MAIRLNRARLHFIVYDNLVRQDGIDILQMLYEQWSETHDMLGARVYNITVESDPKQLREGGLRRSMKNTQTNTFPEAFKYYLLFFQKKKKLMLY
jgi:hypothetical protein